jgi:NTE family protein
MKKNTIQSVIIVLIFSISFVHAQNAPKVGLVLSGGGALGYAHVGVIKALEEYGISPQYIAGSSMGAIVGVLYSDGYMPDSILSIVKEDKLDKVRNILNIKSIRKNTGASGHATLSRVLKQTLSTNSFENLKKEYHVCVTDLDHGDYKIINRGNRLAEYVIASASIPGVFETEIIDSTTYVDGGTLNNLPAQALRDKCDVLIGVDVLPYLEKSNVNTTLSVVAWSIRLMQHQNSTPGRNLCDFIIEPDAVRYYNEFSFDKYMEIAQNGYDTMKTYLKSHPELIQKCGGKSTDN